MLIDKETLLTLIKDQADEIKLNLIADDVVFEIIPGQNYIFAQYYDKEKDENVIFKLDADYEDRKEVSVSGLVT